MLLQRTMKAAFVATVPVLVGYLTTGMAFGLLFCSSGFSAGWAMLMSLIVYAGSMQFVAINILQAGMSALQVALMTLAVNLRHVVYGLSLIEKLKDIKGFRKWYMVFSLTDETYALLVDDNIPKDVDPAQYFFVIALLNHVYWLVGTALGAGVGNVLQFNTTGIEFAMTAMFICIATEQWLSFPTRKPAIIGAVATVICLALFGAQNMLIPAMFCIVMALLFMKPTLQTALAEKEEVKHE